MTLNSLISTPLRDARLIMSLETLTLNARIWALDSLARSISLSVGGPTSSYKTVDCTSSFPSPEMLCDIASADPLTSAFMMNGTSINFVSSSSNRSGSNSLISSIVRPSRCFRFSLFEITFLAKASLDASRAISPASGMSFQPDISTGVEGPATFTGLPYSSFMALTLHHVCPATNTAPGFNLPFITKKVATLPKPFLTCDSKTHPSTGTLSSCVLISCNSATATMVSSSSSIPIPVLAEILTVGTSPP
ncbi:hypothetical protein OGATHE_001153 [Ogataea polymorpha]|uniref:Uncharacterized protein n=1 Tax=Ogataea polymorpha TaxID=460523 RepID=A0A9P8PST0_9ASCO|nr:hypothetical protein OGATHE_001153 [Ogataea polymorpha]